MSQGVACPNGRPLHSETPAVVDFGPSFTDLSRGGETESYKQVAKVNVELLGRINSRFFFVFRIKITKPKSFR